MSGWGLFVTVVAVVLLATAFVGNLLASRRRRTPRVSVYDVIRRRLDAERGGGPT